MNNQKIMAKHCAVDFFKKKSEDNNKLYIRDMQKIFEDYDDFRKAYFQSEKKVAKLTQIVCRQERIGSELKVFINEALSKVFDVVLRKTPEIME